MSEYVQVILIANLFRLACLIVGFAFGYLGYRLYAIGVFEKAQELRATFGNSNITLKQVAPGVVFGISGIAIAVLSIARPLVVDRTANTPMSEMRQTGSGNAAPCEANLSGGDDPSVESAKPRQKEPDMSTHFLNDRPRHRDRDKSSAKESIRVR